MHGKVFKNCSRALFHLGLDIRGGQAFWVSVLLLVLPNVLKNAYCYLLSGKGTPGLRVRVLTSLLEVLRVGKINLISHVKSLVFKLVFTNKEDGLQYETS